MNPWSLKKFLVALCLISCLVWVIELKTPTLFLPKEIKVKRWASYPFPEQGGLPVFINFKYKGSTYYLPISSIAVIYEEKKKK
ncbi:MAG: hypothetical protein ACFFCW_24345 [Candidatus Hodarchaeota archaeon]